MQRIKLMTDSASDLPNELAQQLGIEIIPFPIAVDGKGYMEGVDFTPRQFYDIMQNAKEIPRRFRPSPTASIITAPLKRATPMSSWSGFRRALRQPFCARRML